MRTWEEKEREGRRMKEEGRIVSGEGGGSRIEDEQRRDRKITVMAKMVKMFEIFANAQMNKEHYIQFEQF